MGIFCADQRHRPVVRVVRGVVHPPEHARGPRPPRPPRARRPPPAPRAPPPPPSLLTPRDQSPDQSPAERNLVGALGGSTTEEDLAKLKQSTKICVLVSDGENNDSADYNGKKHGTTGEQYPETSEAMKLCKAAVS